MEKPLDEESIAKAFKLEFIPCELYHPYSCEYNAAKRFVQIFRLALKIYLPVHVIPALLFRMKAIRANPWEQILKVFIGVCRSCGFISAYGFLMRLILCKLGQYTGYGRFTWVMSVFWGAISLGIEVENRRTELALYVVPRALEAGWNMLAKRGIVKSPPGGELLLFGISMSALMHFYQNDPTFIKPTYRKIFQVAFGEN